MWSMGKKIEKTFRKKTYQNDYYDNLNNGFVKNNHYQSENVPNQPTDESHGYFVGVFIIFVRRRCSTTFQTVMHKKTYGINRKSCSKVWQNFPGAKKLFFANTKEHFGYKFNHAGHPNCGNRK